MRSYLYKLSSMQIIIYGINTEARKAEGRNTDVRRRYRNGAAAWTIRTVLIIFLTACTALSFGQDRNSLSGLPVYSSTAAGPGGDWLLGKGGATAGIFRSENGKDLVMTNGLISRSFRIGDYMACIDFRNLRTGRQLLRSIEPEAVVEIDGHPYDVGGAEGQYEHAYLQYDWLDGFTAPKGAFRFSGYSIREAAPAFAWKPARWNTAGNWPPKGRELVFYFRHPALAQIGVEVHYILYDDAPLISKWICVINGSGQDVRVTRFASERLAMVEEGTDVDENGYWPLPPVSVQSDYVFGSTHTTCWLKDSAYTSQVSYDLRTPCLLVSRPPIGPDYRLKPQQAFESFHTYELLYDGYDKERNGLSQRKMYRLLAPWASENPIFLHLTTVEDDKVRQATDQCAAAGFEMVILSFGSGLDMEDTSDTNIGKYRRLADYARSKGIEIGGYSLFSSRRIDDANDVINPSTGKTGGAIFGDAPCLGSDWGIAYLQKLKTFISRTGFHILENDGPYPGDICASVKHPGHEGMKDSQWKQWEQESAFYHWLRGSGDVYLNAPDWYFLQGSNKTGVGYREDNWSLPRARQIILGRQNIYDGTWTKTPAMGWTFVPLTEYHGGGEAATIEPLSGHLDAYKAHLVQNFGSGVQACYRGPRLFDAPSTEAMVKEQVAWYKRYRGILNADIIHLRRADGRDYDGILHVDPLGKEKGLAMIYNPLDHPITRTIKLPLYYTGLTGSARIREKEGKARIYTFDKEGSALVKITIPAFGYDWLVIE